MNADDTGSGGRGPSRGTSSRGERVQNPPTAAPTGAADSDHRPSDRVAAPITRLPFQYVVLRCVPRVDREEFVNVGLVLHCELADYLACAAHVRDERLQAVDPGIDLEAVRAALDTVGAVCADDRDAWPSAGDKPGVRFRWLAAPRSTVVQPGPIHGGLTADPAADLDRLVTTLVR